MFIKNVFYKKPALHKLVTDRRQQVFVVPRYYAGTNVFVGGRRGREAKGVYSISLPITANNVERCIHSWVDHCIIIHMLDHPDTKKIDTKDCVMERNEIRKLILCGDPSPEYDIRGLKYLDDMVDLVNFLLN
jgi:hypothetical protein